MALSSRSLLAILFSLPAYASSNEPPAWKVLQSAQPHQVALQIDMGNDDSFSLTCKPDGREIQADWEIPVAKRETWDQGSLSLVLDESVHTFAATIRESGHNSILISSKIPRSHLFFEELKDAFVITFWRSFEGSGFVLDRNASLDFLARCDNILINGNSGL